MEMLGREVLDSRNGTCRGPGEATSLLLLRNRKRPTGLAGPEEPGKGLRSRLGLDLGESRDPG